MKAANELRVSGPLYVKPTIDDVMERIRRLALDERLRLISELKKHKVELGHAARAELVARVLFEFGLVAEQAEKEWTIEVTNRSKRAAHA